MIDIGKLLVILGLILLGLGLVLVLLGRTGLPIGRLPGDIVYRGKTTTFYFPVATSIIVSIVLSLVFYVISRFRR
jgi:Protein of unknown function (DUF2905)